MLKYMQVISLNFEELRKKYIEKIKYIEFSEISSFIKVVSPLRVNLSAGWNDTPPYCNEVNGYIVNAPILLDNSYPIEVTIEKIADRRIVLQNLDNASSLSINNISDLLDCASPYIEFALHKSCIISSGLIPFSLDYSLSTFFDKIDGGFKLCTSVKNIPVGSGLGTSSILIYTIIKSIYKFVNINISDIELFNMTACAEQLMTTGGGYQDQIGAYCPKIKFVEFFPGLYPEIKCHNLSLDSSFENELNDRLVFVYTGKTRVAKNLLQDIMGNYIAKNSNTIDILDKIGLVALEMKNNLLNADFEAFAESMTTSFNLNVELNPNFSNAQIQQILDSLASYLSGYMLSGAGNGGFLTLALKKEFSKSDIKKILDNKFKNTNIKIFDFNILF